MATTSRLPRVLQRLTEVAIVLVALAATLLIGASLFASESFDFPVQYTPDIDAYEVVHESWGDGTIMSSEGIIRFSEGDARSSVIMISTALVLAGPAIVILLALRQVLKSVADGAPFADANGPRITLIGIMVIIWGLVGQAAQTLATWMVMDESAASGLHLETNIRPNLTIVFLGLVVLALGEVFRKGTRLQSDADLTV